MTHNSIIYKIKSKSKHNNYQKYTLSCNNYQIIKENMHNSPHLIYNNNAKEI